MQCIHKKRNGRKYDLRKGLVDVGSAWIWQSGVLSALLFTLSRAVDHFIVLLLKKDEVSRALCCAGVHWEI